VRESEDDRVTSKVETARTGAERELPSCVVRAIGKTSRSKMI
jgi:hypothetical protein